MPAFDYPDFAFRRPPEMDGGDIVHDVVIIGGGPVGLTLAMDLAQRGIDSVVLQAHHTVSEGSRALCWSKRSLEILDRLGPADAITERGFTWNQGRVLHGDSTVFAFDLQPEGGQKYPAFVNLQQYLAEMYMLEGCEKREQAIDLRWRQRGAGIRQDADGVTVRVETPEGAYDLKARYAVACDGARSTIRHVMGLPFEGRVFEDNFLIADVDTEEEIPWQERRFWFLPDFHAGETALCHKQGDGMWRVDFQLGWDGVDRDAEATAERALPRIKAMLGTDKVSVSWLSVYTFQCRRLERFRHGRIFFAGDAAHQVSPFGARGGNSGIQDAENLAWKLALVLQGRAGDALLTSYDDERSFAADENIRITSRTVDFMTAKSPMRERLREAVLDLAREHPFARAFINSGRLSTATAHTESPLNEPDDPGFAAGPPPGAPLVNAPDGNGNFLLDHLGRDNRFEGLWLLDGPPDVNRLAQIQALAEADEPVRTLVVAARDPDCGLPWIADPEGAIRARLDGENDSYYLLRPDQHVAGRWRRCAPQAVAGRRDAILNAPGGAA